MSSTSTSTPVIVCNSWGNYHVYPATIDYARQLVEEKIEELGEDAIPGMEILRVRKAFKETPDDLTLPYFVDDDFVLRAMKDLLNLKVGEESRALYRLTATGVIEKDVKVPVTKAMRDELVLWSFEHKFDVKNASAYNLEELRPEQSLSFMAGLVKRANGHPIKYVYSADMDEALDLQDLLYGTWKPTARIENVVSRYLTVLNNYCHRDEKYHLGVMEQPD